MGSCAWLPRLDFLHCIHSACFSSRKTLQLARQLKDQAVEAQSCYSLGNTYSLLQDDERAIEYHLKHLAIAQELEDRWETLLVFCVSLQSPKPPLVPSCLF